MAKKNIGATLSLKDGNFFTRLKSATNEAKAFKKTLNEVKSTASGFGEKMKSVGAGTAKALKNTTGDGGLVKDLKSATNEAKTLKKTLNEVKSTASGFGEKMKSAGAVTVKALKATTVATTAVATAVGAVVKQSVEAYADYEQLTSGVETLFGAGGKSLEEYAVSVGKTVEEARGEYNSLLASQNTVLQNASNAYKTAGLSANEYMETVTGFSASLLQSLGGNTQKAASIANLGITDMADNANKMGTSMESIQNAYQGFAKQNYTMLDNLKLGYGGTKEEMQRLLTDAGKIANQKFDISSFSDIINAIHVMQDRMGITGTTADEAENTISGSLNMLKSSWKNTLTSLVTGGDLFDSSIDGLISSASAFGKNIMPAIEGALNGVGKAVEALAPQIAQRLPKVIQNVLPSLISATQSLAQGIVRQIPQIASAVISCVPTTFDGLSGVIGESCTDKLKNAFENLKNAISGIDTSTLTNLAQNIVPMLVGAFANVMNITSGVINVLNFLSPVIFGVAAAMLFYKGATTAVAIAEKAAIIVMGIKKALTMSTSVIVAAYTGAHWGLSAGYGVATAAQMALNTAMLANPVGAVIIAITALVGVIVAVAVLVVKKWDWISEKAAGFWNGIKEMFSKIPNFFLNVFEKVKNNVVKVFETIKDKIKGFWNSLKGLIKTPHIVQTGKIKITGIETPIPKLGLEWYAKGGIMTRPTVFGMNGSNAMVGGESGSEAILPLKPFWQKMDSLYKGQNGGNTVNVEVNVSVNGDNRSGSDLAEEIINAFVPKLKLQLANL